MSLSRAFRRRKMQHKSCPKCHKKMVNKPGYGLVCRECGYMKPQNNKEE